MSSEEQAGEVKLPTPEEIAKLPRWAQVAFAARCARRVQPLYNRDNWLAGGVVAVNTLIGLAEHTGSSGRLIGQRHSAARESYQTAHSILDCANDASDRPAEYSINSALRAFRTAQEENASSIRDALDAARMSIRASALRHPGVDPEEQSQLPENKAYASVVACAVRADLEWLLRAVSLATCDETTVIRPEYFGPIWPSGPPAGWPDTIDHSRYADSPAYEEFSRMQRWARVAFAARCARRVEPLFLRFTRASRTEVDAVSAAILAAETAAANGDPDDNVHSASASAVVASAHAMGRDAQSNALHNTSAEVANAAAIAASSVLKPNPDAFNAFLSAHSAASSAAYATLNPQLANAAHAAMKNDFEILRRIQVGLDHSKSVPPEQFGPMWPNGQPSGWPLREETVDREEGIDGEIAGPFSVYIDPKAYSPEEAGEFLSILSEVYESVSGDRLVIDGTGHSRVLIDEPVLPGGGS